MGMVAMRVFEVFIMTLLSSLGDTSSQAVGSRNNSGGGFKFAVNITSLGNFTGEQFHMSFF